MKLQRFIKKNTQVSSKTCLKTKKVNGSSPTGKSEPKKPEEPKPKAKKISQTEIEMLKGHAVSAMAYARPRRSGLAVGCSLLDTKNNYFTGANVELLWQRCSHAEENTIIGSITHDGGEVRAICIAADRELFTPCGHCMDLILEFSQKTASIIHYNPRTRKTTIIPLKKMMPYYPTRK